MAKASVYRSADIFSRRLAALEEREKAADAEKDRLDLGALADESERLSEEIMDLECEILRASCKGPPRSRRR